MDTRQREDGFLRYNTKQLKNSALTTLKTTDDSVSSFPRYNAISTVVSIAENTTLTHNDNGKIFLLDGNGTYYIYLPDIKYGIKYGFFMNTLNTDGGAIYLKTNESGVEIRGIIPQGDDTGGEDIDYRTVYISTPSVGDYITLKSTNTHWFGTGVSINGDTIEED